MQYVNSFVHPAALRTTPTHFPLSSHPMWLFFSWYHAAQRGARLVNCQRRADGLHSSLPVYCIAYTQPIWPALVLMANLLQN